MNLMMNSGGMCIALAATSSHTTIHSFSEYDDDDEDFLPAAIDRIQVDVYVSLSLLVSSARSKRGFSLVTTHLSSGDSIYLSPLRLFKLSCEID